MIKGNEFVLTSGISSHFLICFKCGLFELVKILNLIMLFVKIDSMYFRSTEIDMLLVNLLKGRKKLDWKTFLNFEGLIADLINKVLNEARKEYLLKSKGFSIYEPKE